MSNKLRTYSDPAALRAVTVSEPPSRTGRVLWIAGNAKPEVGGMQVYLDRLCSALAENCELGICAPPGHEAPAGAIASFGIADLTRPPSAARWESAEHRISWAVRNFAPDIVHFASANMAVYRWALPQRMCTVATVHGNDLTAPWQSTPESDPTATIVAGLNACQRVIAVSAHTEALVREWGVSTRTTVLRSGCDPDFIESSTDGDVAARKLALGISPDTPVLLTVARLVPRKGHAIVLDAIALLPFPVEWLVVGTGPMADPILEGARRAGIAERIHLLGSVSDDDLRLLYRACDLFVLTPVERRSPTTLDSEGFGLVYFEAAAAGKPAIASRGAGCREAVSDGGTGLLVTPGDAHALAEAIQYMLSDTARAREFGERARKLARSDGGWQRLARETLEIYDACVEAEYRDSIAQYRS